MLSEPSRSRVRTATVEIPDLHLRTTPDEHGRFTLYPVPAGIHQLRVTARWFEPLEQPIVMSSTRGAAIGVFLAATQYCQDMCKQAVAHPLGWVENAR